MYTQPQSQKGEERDADICNNLIASSGCDQRTCAVATCGERSKIHHSDH